MESRSSYNTVAYQQKQKQNPKVLLLGNTGSGKSELGNTLTGMLNQKVFVVSNTTQSCTQKPKCVLMKLFSSTMMVIDTPGWGDSNGEDNNNQKILVQMLKDIGSVTCVLLVINSENPRFDKQLQQMFIAYGDIFLKKLDFLKSTLIVFTRWRTDPQTQFQRKKNNKTEQSSILDMNKQIKEQLGFDTDQYPIKGVFIDNSFNEQNYQDMFQNFEEGRQQIDHFTNSRQSILKFIKKEGQKQKQGLAPSFKILNAHILRLHKEIKQMQVHIRLQLKTYFWSKEQGQDNLYNDILQLMKSVSDNDQFTWYLRRHFTDYLAKQTSTKIGLKIERKVNDVLQQFAKQIYVDLKKTDLGVKLSDLNYAQGLSTATHGLSTTETVVILGAMVGKAVFGSEGFDRNTAIQSQALNMQEQISERKSKEIIQRANDCLLAFIKKKFPDIDANN